MVEIYKKLSWALLEFSVLLKKMDSSAARDPRSSHSIPVPCHSSDLSKLSGVMNLCPANLDGGCFIFCPLGTKACHWNGFWNLLCCMFNAVGCFFLQGLHSLPGRGCCPAIVMKCKEASSEQLSGVGGWPRV